VTPLRRELYPRWKTLHPLLLDPRRRRPKNNYVFRNRVRFPTRQVFTDGRSPTFDAWKRAVRNKLRVNADHYPTEEAKLGYVLSRVEQLASDILELHLDDDAAVPLTMHTQVFDALERVYGVLNEEYLYQSQFELLEQGNTDFNAFVAEFYRLAAPLRRDENSLLNSFRRKLSPTMQRHTYRRDKAKKAARATPKKR
jgi:hypothetical protein